MQIHCPICSTAIEVTEAHSGHKGRCLNCSSKFIIPANPADPVEVLETGTQPSPSSEEISHEAQETDSHEAVVPRAPVLNVPSLASHSGPRPAVSRVVIVKRTGPPVGLLMTFVVGIGLVAGIYVYLSNSETGAGNLGPGAENNASPGKVQNNVTKPVVKVDPGKEPVDSPDQDSDVSPFEVSPSDGSVFEFTDEARKRTLEFLKSEQPKKREGAYTAFRELGDEYKETYEELLRLTRQHHLLQLGARVSSPEQKDVLPQGFENEYQAWKSAAEIALGLIMTKWRDKAAAEYKEKYAEMDRAVEEVEKLYSALVDALKGTKRFKGPVDASLHVFADLILELEHEIAWSLGEDDFTAPDLGELIEEAQSGSGNEEVQNSSGELGKMRSAFARNDEINNQNEQVNWGTSAYKKFSARLNDRRVALGLDALRLEKTLTDASEMHSGDMLFQNYFSHNSGDGTNFAKRAKSSGFTGTPTGECIFRASADSEAAYKAWWYADGQRSVMYAVEPNALGLGSAENYWTLNTGKIKS